MKQLIYFVIGLFALTACNTSHTKTDVEVDVDDTIVIEDNHDDLGSLINNINGYLPIPIDFGIFTLKSVSIDDETGNVALFVYIDEDMEGDWDGDPDAKDISKYLVAQLMYNPESLDKIHELDSEEIEEIRSDESIREALDNPQRYTQIKEMLTEIKDQGLGIKMNLHSRDDYSTMIRLSPSEVADAVIFYKEVWEKTERDRNKFAF